MTATPHYDVSADCQTFFIAEPIGKPSPPELIARRKYSKAIELLRRELERGAGNPRVRMQLADVLVMGGADPTPCLY